MAEISDLGIDVSNQWARNQASVDMSLVKEASSQTEVAVTSPTYRSEFDLLLGDTRCVTTIACFSPPPDFSEQANCFFTYQLMPSLGSEERFNAQTERVHAIAPEEQPTDREAERTTKDKKTILNVLEIIESRNRDLLYINARRPQNGRV